jgi:dienelactone hydrolase
VTAVDERRQAYLAQLRRILPPSEAWEAWLETTGELPPDFDALPSGADPPDPLTRVVGGRSHRITRAAEWEEHRAELKGLFQQWVLGQTPPPPDRMEVRVTGERREPGVTVREVQLVFGPQRGATLRLEVLLPEPAVEGAGNGIAAGQTHRAGPAPADEARPVFMTQWNHRGWALIAVRRGYVGVVYAGADVLDDTDSFLSAYPEYDWSRLTRRAWAASRCIDYLAEHEPRANVEQVVLTGHSRNGKLSLIAAALDKRVSAVISSSSGAGGTMPFRYYGEQHFGESVELLTRAFPQWFHPRLRFFSGREHKLPVDMHQLVALSAPRACLLSSALNDSVESAWAMQQTYLSAQRVYRLLGAEDRLSLLWRPGGHETWTTLIEQYVDWCDVQFGRGPVDHGPAPRAAFPERHILPVDWEGWRRGSDEQIDPPRLPTFDGAPASIQAIQWMLGDEPPAAPGLIGSYGAEAPHIATLLSRSTGGEGLEKRQVTFGEYVAGDVFLPAGPAGTAGAPEPAGGGTPRPAVLWLHPFSVPRGYMAGYMRGEQPVRTLARAGFAVLAFDQIGHGRRIEEAERFYHRHPRWSLLGKMVRDSRAALDALTRLPYVDPARVFVAGYGLGALVGLHLAALDRRPAGIVAVCPPPPFRTDTDVAETGGIARWAKLHLLLPRLGFFEGHEAQIPYDVDDLLAGIAPRPVLVVSPTLDREAPLHRVTEAVERAREAYAAAGASDRLTQLSPEDYNRFHPQMQELVAAWLTATASARHS